MKLAELVYVITDSTVSRSAGKTGLLCVQGEVGMRQLLKASAIVLTGSPTPTINHNYNYRNWKHWPAAHHNMDIPQRGDTFSTSKTYKVYI